MTTLPVYRNVLVPIDLSARAAQALPHACSLVAKEGTIHLLHVLERPELPNPLYPTYVPPIATPAERAQQRSEAEAALLALLRSSPPPNGVVIERHVLEDSASHVVDRICQMVIEQSVDLVCLASHGRRGLARVLLGSIADGVLRRCTAPTLIIRIPKHELGSD